MNHESNIKVETGVASPKKLRGWSRAAWLGGDFAAFVTASKAGRNHGTHEIHGKRESAWERLVVGSWIQITDPPRFRDSVVAPLSGRRPRRRSRSRSRPRRRERADRGTIGCGLRRFRRGG